MQYAAVARVGVEVRSLSVAEGANKSSSSCEIGPSGNTPYSLVRGMPQIAEFEFLVRPLARRYARRESDLQDCEQEARIAAFVAIRDWRPETGKISLKNYIGFRIKHALKEYVRSRYRPGVVSLDASASDEEDAFTGHDTIGAPASQEASIRASRVADRLALLPARLRVVLQMRGEENSQQEIADRLGVNQQRVSQLNLAALALLGEES